MNNEKLNQDADSGDDDIFSHLNNPFDDEDWKTPVEPVPSFPSSLDSPAITSGESNQFEEPALPFVNPDEIVTRESDATGSPNMYSHLESEDLARLRNEDPPSTGDSVDPIQVNQSSGQIVRKTTESGLEYFESETESGVNFFEALASIGNQNPLFWMLNLKAAEGSTDDLSIESRDLLEGGPDEIRASNSLHLIPFHCLKFDDPVLGRALQTESAVCIASDLSVKEILKPIRFLAGWFLNSAALGFHLESSNQLLHSKIFEVAKLVIIPKVNPVEKWVLYNHPTSPFTYQEIGFPVVPNQ